MTDIGTAAQAVTTSRATSVVAQQPYRLRVGDEVAAALATGRAVVALESTLIAHGLPWPDNVQLALELEESGYAQFEDAA
mgnify:CR=1 FL=1